MTNHMDLISVVRPVAVDHHNDSCAHAMKLSHLNVLLTHHGQRPYAVSTDGKRLMIATGQESRNLPVPVLVDPITMEKVDRPASDFPDWRGSRDIICQPEGVEAEVDRIIMLGELYRLAAMAEQEFTVWKEASWDKDDIDCPCDHPGLPSPRSELAPRGVRLTTVSNGVRIEPNWKGIPEATVFGLLSSGGEVSVLVGWWYVVQALAHALSRFVTLTLRPDRGAFSVWSRDEKNVTCTSIIMPQVPVENKDED